MYSLAARNIVNQFDEKIEVLGKKYDVSIEEFILCHDHYEKNIYEQFETPNIGYLLIYIKYFIHF